jgi:hypothetical protein
MLLCGIGWWLLTNVETVVKQSKNNARQQVYVCVYICVHVCVCVCGGGWVRTRVLIHPLSWHSSLSAWPLKMGQTDCPKMSVNNYKQMLHNCPEQQRPPK